MIVQFMFAFLYSIIFALILTFFFKRRAPGPFHGIFYFFCLIFLFTVALGAWLHPIGPMFRNVPWLSLLAIAFLIMLLMAELLPHREKHVVIKRKEILRPGEEPDDEDEEVLESEFKGLFWFILVCLIGAIFYAIFYIHF